MTGPIAKMTSNGQLGRLATQIGKAADTIIPAGTALTVQWTIRLHAAVASRAPVKTGDYRRSISIRTTVNQGAITGEVGTNRPQGRRLEHGFQGADSLGRVYHQDAQPHFGPATEEIRPQFELAVAKLGHDTLAGP